MIKRSQGCQKTLTLLFSNETNFGTFSKWLIFPGLDILERNVNVIVQPSVLVREKTTKKNVYLLILMSYPVKFLAILDFSNWSFGASYLACFLVFTLDYRKRKIQCTTNFPTSRGNFIWTRMEQSISRIRQSSPSSPTCSMRKRWSWKGRGSVITNRMTLSQLIQSRKFARWFASF